MAHCRKCGVKIKYRKVGCRRCGPINSLGDNEKIESTINPLTQVEVARLIKSGEDDLLSRLRIKATPINHTQDKQI